MQTLDRRSFMAAGLGAAAALTASRPGTMYAWSAATWKHQIHKALIGKPSEADLAAWKAAGFEGYESQDRGATPQAAEATRKLAEKHGLRIHGVMFGWANFNRPSAVEGDLAAVETALTAARVYGASTLLLVPCRISAKMPDPWTFDVRFDEKTGHLKQVVAGDNAPYADYIAQHNRSADASREAVKRLIPVAEKQGIIIAIENVWNNMWVVPEFHKQFVESFDSPWIRAYFDIGNHVKYCPTINPPEKWIRTLGKLIAKCHVKDFKLGPEGHGGAFCDIREGSVHWPNVRAALDEIDYSGWVSIEGGTLPPQEHGRRLDLILAGK